MKQQTQPTADANQSKTKENEDHLLNLAEVVNAASPKNLANSSPLIEEHILENDFEKYLKETQNMFNELIKRGINEGNELIKRKFLCSMDTPYQYHKRNNKISTEKQPPESKAVGKLKQFAKKIFKHYEVNPSKKGYNDTILETYVKQVSQPGYLLNDLDMANQNGVCGIFITKIKQSLKQIKNNHAMIPPEDKIIYVTGIRGSGKTAFFNYFISKHEEELNKEKVITVRVNVMKIPKNIKLEDAIEFKICRILFTYYCSHKKNEPRLAGRKFKDYINPIIIRIKEKNRFHARNLTECHDYFCGYNPSSKLLTNIPQRYSTICQALLQEMSKQYKFIIMLDNFDQLNPNDRSKEEYNTRKLELENLSTRSFFDHCLFLVAIRYATYKGLTANTNNKKIRPLVIGTPNTYDMIKLRVDYFNKLNGYSIEEQQKNEEVVTKCVQLVGSSFYSENSILDFKSACTVIDSIFSENKRIILNISNRFLESIPEHTLEDSNQIFKESFLSAYQYKFFESLLIKTDNDNSDVADGYCHLFYEYLLINDELKFGSVNQKPQYDNSYLPNIYRFPAISGNNTMMFIPFLKIRILQLLKNNTEELSTNNVCNILYNVFSYRKDAIKLACTELREDQSLMLDDDTVEETMDHEDAILNITMQITERGKKHLEILPINANILAVSLEQMFFLKNHLEKIPIGNYFSKSDDFIFRNIFCSLPKVIGLFRCIEQKEKEEFEKKITNNEEYVSYFNIQNDFSFTERLEEQAANIIKKIIESYFIPSTTVSEASATTRQRRLNAHLSNILY